MMDDGLRIGDRVRRKSKSDHEKSRYKFGVVHMLDSRYAHIFWDGKIQRIAYPIERKALIHAKEGEK